MAEWLGHLIQNWPVGLVIVLVIVSIVAYFIFQITVYGGADEVIGRQIRLRKRLKEEEKQRAKS